jgi:hypothetical protein
LIVVNGSKIASVKNQSPKVTAKKEFELENKEKICLPKPKESTHRTILNKLHPHNKPSSIKNKQSVDEL